MASLDPPPMRASQVTFDGLCYVFECAARLSTQTPLNLLQPKAWMIVLHCSHQWTTRSGNSHMGSS